MFYKSNEDDGKNYIEYFHFEEIEKVKKQKKITLAIYFIALALYVIASGIIFWWYLTLPYKSSSITLVRVSEYSISGVFVIFSFIYLGIVYKRVKKYYKLCSHFKDGIKEVYTGSFFEYDETIQVKDGVDFKALIFIEWNKYKNDFFERKVLVFNEKPFPVIEEKANVRYVTQGNVLLKYEILS